MPELLEREGELDAIGRALADLADGIGRLVVISGVAGVGKTGLVDAARSLATARGVRVLRAAGTELERQRPFGAVVDLLSPAVDGTALSGAARLAGPLLTDEPRGPVDEHGLLHGLGWLVSDLAEAGQLMLVVDDAHWADRLSLRLLVQLAERIDDLPLLAVVALRPTEPGAEQDLVERLLNAEGAARLSPRPLSRNAVARLLGAEGPPDAEFLSACHEVTRGNPLLLRELLIALDEEGAAQDATGARRAREIGPEPVARAVALSIDRMGVTAHVLTEAVAVLGDDGDVGEAATLTGIDAGTLEASAADLKRAGIFDRTRQLSFAHAIVAAAVRERTSSDGRAMLHRRAAVALHARGRSDDRVAAHLLAAPGAGETWAVDVLEANARSALARGAPPVAARYLQRALDEPAPTARQPELLAALGRAQAAAGDPEAPDSLRAAADLAPAGAKRAVLALERGGALVAQGRFSEAAAALKAGLDDLGSGDDNLRYELEAAWAGAAVFSPALGASAAARIAPLLSAEREPRSRG